MSAGSEERARRWLTGGRDGRESDVEELACILDEAEKRGASRGRARRELAGALRDARSQLAAVTAERDEARAERDALRADPVWNKLNDIAKGVLGTSGAIDAAKDARMAAIRSQLAAVQAERDRALEGVVVWEARCSARVVELLAVQAERDEALEGVVAWEARCSARVVELLAVQAERDEALARFAMLRSGPDDAAREAALLEFEKDGRAWMTHEDLVGHYVCAIANWGICLDERDAAFRERDDALRDLDEAQTSAELARKYGVNTDDHLLLAETLGLREGKHTAASIARIAREKLAERGSELRDRIERLRAVAVTGMGIVGECDGCACEEHIAFRDAFAALQPGDLADREDYCAK